MHFLFEVLLLEPELAAPWYAEPNAVANAIGYAQFYSRSHDAAIRVYDHAGNVIVILRAPPGSIDGALSTRIS